MIGFIELQSRINHVWASSLENPTTESTTTRTAGGLDFSAIGGKRQGREVPQSLRVKPGAKHPVWKTQSTTQESKFPIISWLDKMDTHWGGRLKTIGSATFAKDDTIFEPVGTGTYLNLDTDLRINNEIFFSDWGYLETQYEAILAGGKARKKRQELSEIFPNFEGSTIFFGAPLKDDGRFMDLTHTIKEEDSYILLQRLDRLNLTLKPNWGLVRIGRQAITWGNGLIFNPMDLFNPFPPADIQRDYKVGDDMVLAQVALPRSADLQLLYVVRRDPDTNNAEADRNSLAGLLHFAVGTTEFDIMATRHFDDYVVGFGTSGILGGAAWRLDSTATFLNDGKGQNTKNYVSAVANMDYSWDLVGEKLLWAFGVLLQRSRRRRLPGSTIESRYYQAIDPRRIIRTGANTI